MITKDRLVIVADDNGSSSETAGMAFFGLWSKNDSMDIKEDTLKQLWGNFICGSKLRQGRAEDHFFSSIEFPINNWPETNGLWIDLIKTSLEKFIDGGALIAWCGDEYSNSNPDVFNPESNAGEVYAALLPKLGFICNSSLYDEYQVLSDNQLYNLQQGIKELL